MKKYRTGNNIQQTTLTYPSAWIVTNNRVSNSHSNDRGRRKIYTGNKIYLDDNQQFEIELFNPTAKSMLACININGDKISNSGLVLRPGERVYLDCFFESKKKFVFKTYQTENSEEAKKAIQNNGIIEILFYPEKSQFDNPINITGTTQNPTVTIPDNWLNRTNISTGGYTGGNGFFTTNGFTPNSSDYTYTTNLSNNVNTDGIGLFGSSATGRNADLLRGSSSQQVNNNPLKAKTQTQKVSQSFLSQTLNDKIETGRIESGEKSDQKFQNVDMDFESMVYSSVVYYLLPEKIRPITIEDFKPKNYCNGCGKKLVGNENFCSSCGIQLK